MAPTMSAWTGLAFPFTKNGSSSSVAKLVGERARRSGVVEDLSGLGLGHQAGGQVHGVTHHGEGPPVGRPDLADEDRAPVHPDPQIERGTGVHDLPDAEQHPVLVVTRGGRGPGRQDDLAPVAVDVGGQEGHLLPVGGRWTMVHQRVEAVGGGLGTLALDEVVGAVEVQEGHGHPAVLGVLAGPGQGAPQSDGDAPDQLHVGVDDLEGHEGVLGYGRRPAQEVPAALGLADDSGSERGGRARD